MRGLAKLTVVTETLNFNGKLPLNDRFTENHLISGNLLVKKFRPKTLLGISPFTRLLSPSLTSWGENVRGRVQKISAKKNFFSRKVPFSAEKWN